MEKLYLVIRTWEGNPEPSLVITKLKNLPSHLTDYKSSKVSVYEFNLEKIQNALEEVEFSISIKQK